MKNLFGHADRTGISIRSLMFVTGATLVLFAPAFAQGPNGPDGRPGQNLVNGKVQEVNSANKSLAVNTRGGIQSITINSNTTILEQTTASVDDIKVGDTVRISGALSGTGSKTIFIGDISDLLLPSFGAGPQNGMPPSGGPQDGMQGPPPMDGQQGGFDGPEGARGPRPPMMGQDGQQPPSGGPQGGFGGPQGEMGGMPPMMGGGPEGAPMMPPPPGAGPQGLKGKVTSVSPLTIELNDDVSLVIKTSNTIKVVKLAPVQLSSIKAGDRIIAKGETNENGKFIAKTIGVNVTPPMPGRPEGFGEGRGQGRPGGFGGHQQQSRQHPDKRTN